MAVNVAPSVSSDTVQEEEALREEIRRTLEEIERLHQSMQADDKKAEIGYLKRQATLDQMKSEMKRFFGEFAI